MGLTFARPRSNLWGSVVGRFRRGGLEVLVSTSNRRITTLAVILIFGVMVPYFVLIATLSALRILPDPNREPFLFLVLGFGYAALIIVLGYEIVMGVFPATRILQRIMMLACDRAAVRLGGEPTGRFRMVIEFVKTSKVSIWEWRIWKRRAWQWLWRPWPDMITEEEFLKEA